MDTLGFFEKVKRTIISGSLPESAYESIRGELHESNRGILMVFSLIAVIICAALSALSLMIEALSGYTLLYVCGLFGTMGVYLLSRFPGKNNHAVQLVALYLFASLLFAVGIVLGTVLTPTEISATYIALLLAVPQLFTDRPYRMYALICLSVILFILMTVTVKAPSTHSSDITNALLFGVISLILTTHSVCTKVTRFYMQDRIRYMAEKDQLTGLNNRNSYEHTLLCAAMLDSSSIYCVYVDVNGLHELNNTCGHSAGDKMLQYVASVMMRLFGEYDTYRIGGDEFVAVGLDKNLETIQTLAEEMKRDVTAAGYHIAVGISFRTKKEIELNALVNEAEHAMYIDKAAYYKESGIDRRRRR